MNIEIILGRVINEGDTVFDAGGYVGDVALFMTSCVKADGCVYSFEPHPDSFRALKAKADKYSNLKAFNYAVSNSTDPVILHYGVAEGTSQASTICTDLATSDRLGEEITSIEIPAITLDQFAGENGLSPAVIKIDVEGAEAFVLEGAKSILKTKPAIIFEMGATTAIPDYAAKLRAMGYDLYFIEIHRFTTAPPSWEHTVNTETDALRDSVISFTDAGAESMVPFLSNVLAISPEKMAQLSGLRIMPLEQALPLLAHPKRSLSAKFKGFVRRVLITKSIEQKFPGTVAVLRNFGKLI